MLDIEVTRSFIDFEIVKKVNLPIHRINSKIFLEYKKMYIARTDYTDDITIEYNNRTVITNLEVFELKYPFIIGTDLIYRFGLSISGIDNGRDSTQYLP